MAITKEIPVYPKDLFERLTPRNALSFDIPIKLEDYSARPTFAYYDPPKNIVKNGDQVACQLCLSPLHIAPNCPIYLMAVLKNQFNDFLSKTFERPAELNSFSKNDFEVHINSRGKSASPAFHKEMRDAEAQADMRLATHSQQFSGDDPGPASASPADQNTRVRRISESKFQKIEPKRENSIPKVLHNQHSSNRSFENEKFQTECKQLWSAGTTARKKALPEAFLPTITASYDVQSDSSLSAEEDSDSYTDISNDEDENPSDNPPIEIYPGRTVDLRPGESIRLPVLAVPPIRNMSGVVTPHPNSIPGWIKFLSNNMCQTTKFLHVANTTEREITLYTFEPLGIFKPYRT